MWGTAVVGIRLAENKMGGRTKPNLGPNPTLNQQYYKYTITRYLYTMHVSIFVTHILYKMMTIVIEVHRLQKPPVRPDRKGKWPMLARAFAPFSSDTDGS